MAKAKRDVGQEILEGIRQLKRGEHGRVVKVPSVYSHPRKNRSVATSIRRFTWSVSAYPSGMGARSSCTVRRSPNIAARRGQESWRSP